MSLGGYRIYVAQGSTEIGSISGMDDSGLSIIMLPLSTTLPY